MSALVIDASFNPPNPRDVRFVGYFGMIGYFSRDPRKNWTPALRDEALKAGLALGFVSESGAGDWVNNPSLAVTEAKEAVAQAKALGVPAGTGIYFAVDVQSELSLVAPSFIQARPIVKDSGYLFGIYGGDTVTDPLIREGVCDLGWQAAPTSWGDGKVSPVCSLFQRVSKTLADCGGTYDENVVLKMNAGLWLPEPSSPPVGSGTGEGTGAGPALPVPVPPPWSGRDLVYPPLTSGADVKVWQARMAARGWRIAVDGVYGPDSRQVCLEFQREMGLSPDGIVGPLTWNASWTRPITKG